MNDVNDTEWIEEQSKAHKKARLIMQELEKELRERTIETITYEEAERRTIEKYTPQPVPQYIEFTVRVD